MPGDQVHAHEFMERQYTTICVMNDHIPTKYGASVNYGVYMVILYVHNEQRYQSNTVKSGC